MPNRILRDWTDSKRVDQLSPQAEVFFTRLIMKVDDHGRFHADPRMLRSACFPLKESFRTADISRWLAECETAGLLRTYDSSGNRYVCILRFNQRLRILHERFPSPPTDVSQMTDTCPTPVSHASAAFVSDSVSDSVSVSLRGKEGVGEKGPQPTTEEKGYHAHARTVLHALNEACGKHFREVHVNLEIITMRLNEPDITLDGVLVMIKRQCRLWMGTPQAEYLRPETLFRKSKFESYYASKDLPVQANETNNGHRTSSYSRPTSAERRNAQIIGSDAVLQRIRERVEREKKNPPMPPGFDPKQ